MSPKMKKFSCLLARTDGVREPRVYEAESKKALQRSLKEKGLTALNIREEFSIIGSLVLFLFFCFFIAPAAPVFDMAFMSTLVLIGIGGLWSVSLVTRNARKAIVPALVTLVMLAWVTVINVHFNRGLRLMKPEGNRIAAALEAYHGVYADYPKQLDQLVPRFLPAVPEKPFRYYYFYESAQGYGLVVGISPFDVVYVRSRKEWVVHYPD